MAYEITSLSQYPLHLKEESKKSYKISKNGNLALEMAPFPHIDPFTYLTNQFMSPVKSSLSP